MEDNFFNQMVVSKVLENWKCKVDIAGNGKIAIDKINAGTFDLILMDIQMPEMDGYETASYIRIKIPPPKCNIPIIAMTAHSFGNEIEKCLKCGMNDYISKPFDEAILSEKILKMVNRNA
ncbi:MAG: response regulator [Nitrososphaeraceae archaeon]